ncbi:short chain dehydrogenase [Armillaria solidipes]|uniref:Short chain dehydrogenase n=1 Tax=Armillaria solidipes TaxID=1076256 RepID=A0A2H3BLK6_9AGAR|nr:short chain dehydrogenase [Armillaria solidipes]
MSTSQLVWLITGTSSDSCCLERGEKVIATARARSLHLLADLKEKGAETLELDVTAPLDDLKKVADKAVGIYGRVDVLVNNAGYILVGALEESTSEETFDQFNTNVFGALNVTRAFFPHMRARRTGTFVWLGSIGGWRAVPNAGLYGTTKWALRGISETLQVEVSPLGLRSICIDFGYFRTSFLKGDNRKPYVAKIDDYKEITEKVESALQAYNGKQPGDPKKGVQVMLDVVRGEGVAQGKEFPNSLLLGSDCFEGVQDQIQGYLKLQKEWEDVSKSTDF